MTKTNKTLLCVLLALVMTFALALTALTVTDTQTAKAEGETAVKTLTFPDDNKESNGIGAYDKTWTAKIGTDEWTIVNFNNNSWSNNWTYIKAGKDVSIVTKEAYAEAITKVVVKFSGVASGTYKMTLSVANNANFTDATQTEMTVASGDVAFEIAEPQANCYYKLSGSNSATKKYQIDSVTYYANDSTGGETEEGTVAVTVNGKALKTDTSSKYFELANGARLDFVTIEDNNVLKPSGEYEITLSGGDSVTKENYLVTINGVEATFEEDNKTINGTAAADAKTLEITFACRHNTVTPKGAKEATCTEAGYEASWECDECATLFDSAEKTNVIEAAKVIDALGHEYSNGACTRCGAEEPKEADYTIGYDIFDGSYASNNKEFTLDSGLVFTANQVCKQGALQFQSGNGYIILKDLKISKIKLTVTQGTFAVYETTYPNVATGSALTADEGEAYTYSFDGTQARALQIKVTSGTGKITQIEIWTAPEVEVPASKFEIEQSITAGEGSKEGMVTTESGEVKTIYIAPNGQIVVTYNITTNEGINTFIGTLNYDKNLFQIVSVTVTDIFGEGAAIKSGKYDVDEFKVYVEGDGTGFNKTAKGDFIVVTYKYIGTTDSVLTGAEFGFVEGSVECYTNSTSGYVNAEVTVNAPAEKLDLIKTATITLNEVAAGGTVSVTYNAKALTVNLELNNPSLIVRSDNTGKIVTTWYSDAARQNKIDAPTTVGTYYLTVVIESNGQYAESTADFTIVIEQYEIDYDALQVIASPNNKALSDGTATWEDKEITIEGLSDLPDQTDVYTVTYGTKSFDTVGDHTITVKVVITNANYKFVSKDGFATGDSETEYNGGVKVSVSAKAIDLVLPELADKYYDAQPISLAGITASVEGEDLEVSIEIKVNDVVVTSENIASYIVNAGSYKISVRAWIEGNANYKEVTGSINVTIKQLTLYIDESMLTYNGSTVSWENVVKAYKETTADTVDLASFTGVTVSYKVTNGSEHDYDVENNKFDANSLAVIAQLTLQAIPSDTVNFKMSGVELEMVYAVTFAASTTPEVAEDVVKVFNNQPVAEPKTQVEGYRLDGWYLPEAEDAYKFDTLVTGNITLTAKWVKLITITWYAEDGTTVLKTVTADIDTTATYIDDTHTAPTKDATTYIDYAFNKWVAMNDAATKYDLKNVFTLTEDIEVKASFTGTVARMTVKYVVVYGNGTAADEVEIGIVNVGKTVSEIGLPELAKYTWFTASAWMNGETEFTVVEANALDDDDHTITLTATYVFAIGNGDVDGNGAIDTKDITLYRQVIVGGYDITTVENAWETATAEGFAYEQGKFYLVAVANVDGDEAGKTDIRDVSTIRMALVEGYGYVVKDGAVVKATNTTALNSARSAAPKQVLAPMGLFGKKFAL